MRVRKLDDLGDMVFGRQNEYYEDEANGVAQDVMTRLKLWKGQWFLDTEEGTPWIQEILGKHRGADAVIKKRIVETEGVKSLDDFEAILNPDTRVLTIAATITTIYGDTATIEGSF